MKPTRLKTQEFSVVTYYHEVPPDTSPNDLLDPSYWVHVAAQLRPRHRIVCDAVDGSWTMTLHIRAVGKSEAFVATEAFTSFDQGPSDEDLGPYDVKFIGANSRWSVVKPTGDNSHNMIKDGFQTRNLAVAWVDEHLASLAPKPEPKPKPKPSPAAQKKAD